MFNKYENLEGPAMTKEMLVGFLENAPVEENTINEVYIWIAREGDKPEVDKFRIPLEAFDILVVAQYYKRAHDLLHESRREAVRSGDELLVGEIDQKLNFLDTLVDE
ncbi:MAG: hypothetical protein PHF79_01445 [Candidatus Pacebacteria bacterium]|nr:hypothetical protein [Candidatus Paceibacterota bacterium]